MKSNIFVQALQIIFYKKVHGWDPFELRAVSLALLVMAHTLISMSQDQIPDVEDADKRRGKILEMADAGRYGDTTVVLQEADKIHGYPLWSRHSVEELQHLVGQEAIISTYQATGFLGLTESRVLEIEIGDQRQLNILAILRQSSDLYRGGFRFFAKGLLIVVFGLYLSLVHKLYKKNIILKENKFIWVHK